MQLEYMYIMTWWYLAACGKIMWQCVSCQKIKRLVVEVRVKNNHGQVSACQ